MVRLKIFYKNGQQRVVPKVFTSSFEARKWYGKNKWRYGPTVKAARAISEADYQKFYEGWEG